MADSSYAGMSGFLGTRASLMLDVVFLAMFLVIPLLATSVWLARARRHYAWHKRMQLTLGGVLLAAVTLFEIDMRVNGWEHRALDSAYYPSEVWLSLYVHLVFAVSTALLWIGVIVAALRHFPNPPAPNEHSRSHRFWAWLATIDMALTAVTGWIFYLLAFVA